MGRRFRGKEFEFDSGAGPRAGIGQAPVRAGFFGPQVAPFRVEVAALRESEGCLENINVNGSLSIFHQLG
jgi:hypothetical protein